jgi:hypothetical protein
MPDRPSEIQGEHAVSFEFDFPETSAEGKTREVKTPVWIREDVVRELRGVLNTDMASKRIKVLDGLTAVQLMQIADAVTHAKNLSAALSVAQGAKGGALVDIARGVPGVGTVDALRRVITLSNEVMKDSPTIRAEQAFLAQNGMLRPEFPATGIQKVTHGQQFLYKIDTAVRINMNRLFDNMVDQGKALDSMENRRKFVNYAGQYNRRLMGPVMKKFADLGISPFIVAGRNFNRMGVRWITGDPGIEGATNLAAAQMRAVNLTKTAITMTVLPMTLNMLTTGSPMGRTGTPMGAWDLGTDEKESGQHRTIDLAQIIGLRRGLRATGLEDVIEGVRSGKSIDQIAGNMMKDISSTATHPWMGPGPGFIFKAATGKQFDIRGKMEAKAYPGEHGRQIVENIRASLESQNPLLYSLAAPAFETVGLQSSAGTKMGAVGDWMNKGSRPGSWAAVNEVTAPGKFVDTFLKSPSGAFGVKDAFPAKGAAETMAGDITAAKLGDRGAMTKADAERYERVNKYTRPVLEAMKTGQDIPDKVLDEAAADEKLTEADIKAIDQRIKQGTALRHKMNTLTAEEALEVYAVATPEEKQDIEDLVIKKLDGVKDQDRVDKLMPRFNKVFAMDEPEPRAEGGPVEKNKPYIVGEENPEMFVPTERPNFSDYYKTVPKEKNNLQGYALEEAYNELPYETMVKFATDPAFHLGDKYKTADHITFSTGSKYSTPETLGGEWKTEADKKWHYYASPFVVNKQTPERLIKYFQEQEPNSVLHLPPMPLPAPRAKGGPVQSGKPYIVGENAPEVFVPKQDGMIIPMAKPNKPSLGDTKWWNQTHGLPPEARARVFYAKLKKVSPAEQSEMFDKAEIIKGFISDKFVVKLKQLKDNDVVDEPEQKTKMAAFGE